MATPTAADSLLDPRDTPPSGGNTAGPAAGQTHAEWEAEMAGRYGGPRGGKVDVFDFVKHEHSLLGLWFAGDEERPAVALCCCCFNTDALERRQRLFVFFFVLAGAMVISIRCTLGLMSGFTAFLFTACVLVPLTCLLKSSIANWSKALQQAVPLPANGPRAEELMLLGLVLWAVIDLAREAGTGVAADAVETALQAWGAALVAEAVSLVWKYLYCRVCCRCCLPAQYKWDDTGKAPAEGAAGQAAATGGAAAAV